MSEHEKGQIMQQMQKLPPLLQARAEGFVQGLSAGMSCAEMTAEEETGKEGEPDERPD